MTDVKTAEAALAKAKATGDRDKIRTAQRAVREARWQARKVRPADQGGVPDFEGTHAEYLAACRAARAVPAPVETAEGEL